MLRSRLHRDEQGAVLVIAALVLTLLLGIAALVIDVGYGFEKKRQIQNTADAAALAGAQDLPLLTTAVASAQANASRNLPDGSLDWAGCTDSKHLAIVSSASQCISFDPSFTRIRVKVPQQTYPTLFAKVLGIDTISASAGATARIVGAGFASIQPFTLFSGFNGGIACLKQGPSGNRIETCDDPETGNFFLLDITQYGNETLGTPRNCGNSAQRVRMIDNIAIGADHIFTAFNGTTEVVDACDVAGPDTIPPRTGNDLDAFDLGIVHGTSSNTSDGGGARLTRGQFDKATVMGRELDNKPMWEFIPDETLPDVPASCQRATFDQLLSSTAQSAQRDTMTAALDQCFHDYESGGYTGVVFGLDSDPFGKEVPVDLYDIQLSPRLIYIPQFAQTEPPNGSSGNLNITAFRAVYLHEVYSQCTNRNDCQVQFAPGPWNSESYGASNDRAQAMSAFVIYPTMLPIGLRGSPASIGQNNFVQLVE